MMEKDVKRSDNKKANYGSFTAKLEVKCFIPTTRTFEDKCMAKIADTVLCVSWTRSNQLSPP